MTHLLMSLLDVRSKSEVAFLSLCPNAFSTYVLTSEKCFLFLFLSLSFSLPVKKLSISRPGLSLSISLVVCRSVPPLMLKRVCLVLREGHTEQIHYWPRRKQHRLIFRARFEYQVEESMKYLKLHLK